MSHPIWSNVGSWLRRKTPLAEVLHSLPLFSELSASQLREVEHIVHLRTYSVGEVIFHAGDAGVAMFVILAGKVRIVLPGDSPEESRELAELEEGALFGELGLLDSSPRSAAAIAGNTVEAAAIARPDWMDLINRRPDIGVKMLLPLAQMVAVRLRIANQSNNGKKGDDE